MRPFLRISIALIFLTLCWGAYKLWTVSCFWSCQHELASLIGEVEKIEPDGKIFGTVWLEKCELNQCPKEIKLKVYQVETGKSHFVSEFSAKVVDDWEKFGSIFLNKGHAASQRKAYLFEFYPEESLHCKELTFAAVDPRNKQEVELGLSGNIDLWRGISTCEQKQTPGLSVSRVDQRGSLISIFGNCAGAADSLQVVGDISNNFTNEVPCLGGKFNYCGGLGKSASKLQVKIVQEVAAQMSEQTLDFKSSEVQINRLDILEIMSDQHGVKMSGECVSGSRIYLDLEEQERTKCENEKFLFKLKGLNLADVVGRELRQATKSGRMASMVVPDIPAAAKQKHQCRINRLHSDGFCGNKSGVVGGHCVAGLPVKILINEKVQAYSFCDRVGKFAANNIILRSGYNSSLIQVHQDLPGMPKICEDSVSATYFY